MRVILVRHLAVRVESGVCYGRLDLPALDDGSAEALALTLADCGAERLWSSPALRCRALARAVGAVLDLPVVTDPRLWELDFGAWEGSRWDDVPREALDRWAADPGGFAPPGGESADALLARVADFAAMLRRDGRGAVVVTHGGPLRMLGALLRGEAPDPLSPAPPLGSVEVVEAHRGQDASSVSTAHSVSTEPAPSTSPVCPPS